MDRITNIQLLGHDAVNVTFEDSQGFTAVVSISREDVARLSLLMSRTVNPGPSADELAQAGAYLVGAAGYAPDVVLGMSDWGRIWTAEADGWQRPKVQQRSR